MADEQSLADKVKAFDIRFGPDLSEHGVKALSEVAHGKLRDLLQESGYQVTYCEKTGENHFPFGQRNLYTRTTDKGLDVFLELNVEGYSRTPVIKNMDGFTYLKLESIKDYENFQKAYKHRNGNTALAVWGTGGFFSFLGSAVVTLATMNPIWIFCILNGAINAAVPFGINEDYKTNLRKKINKLQIETNPREAIKSALDWYPTNSDVVQVLEGRARE